MPAGGTTGQVLEKHSGTDYDTVWATGGAGGASVSVQPTPPTAPVQGDLWWRNDPDGTLYVYYDDGSSAQFVPATPTVRGPGVSIGPSAPPSPHVGDLWWRTTDGNMYVYYNDGTSSQFVPAMASVGKLIGGQYYLMAGAISGAPPASLSLGYYVAALAFTLPSSLAGSQAVAKVAATAQTDIDVRVNGVSKGSIRWAATATVATFVWTAAVSIVAGDRIELLAPALPDATLGDFTWTLRGTL